MSGTGENGEKNRAAGDGTDEWTDVCSVPSLPFMDWIQLVNIPKLFAKLGITREAAGSLYSSYSIFSLLGFVKNSGKGVFGLYAMLLLILLAATWYLELLYIWKVFRNSKGDDGVSHS